MDDRLVLGLLVIERSEIEEHLIGDDFSNVPNSAIQDLLDHKDNPDVVLHRDLWEMEPIGAILFSEELASGVAAECWRDNRDTLFADYSDYVGGAFGTPDGNILSVMAVS